MINSLHNHCWVRGWKKVWKSVNICRSYGQSTGSFIYETWCSSNCKERKVRLLHKFVCCHTYTDNLA